MRPILGVLGAAALADHNQLYLSMQHDEHAPFDAILVTTAPDHVPQPLVDQLAPGGRLVIPVGPRAGEQELLVITKARDGHTVTRRTLAVRFVPLTR